MEESQRRKNRIIAQKVGRCKNYEIIIPGCASSIYPCIVPSFCVCECVFVFGLVFGGYRLYFGPVYLSLFLYVCIFVHMCEEEMFKKPFKRHLVLGNVCSTNKEAKWEEKTTNHSTNVTNSFNSSSSSIPAVQFHFSILCAFGSIAMVLNACRLHTMPSAMEKRKLFYVYEWMQCIRHTKNAHNFFRRINCWKMHLLTLLHSTSDGGGYYPDLNQKRSESAEKIHTHLKGNLTDNQTSVVGFANHLALDVNIAHKIDHYRTQRLTVIDIRL